MAIVSALNSSAVLRLRFTKGKLTKRSVAVLDHFESLMNMEGAQAVVGVTTPRAHLWQARTRAIAVR